MSPEESTAARATSPRARRVALAAVGAFVAGSVVGAAFSPYLLTHAPALLLLLSPEARHLVLVAGLLPAGVVIPLVVVRRVLALVALYAVGWIYGQAAVEFAESRMGAAGRFLRWVEAQIARWGAAVILVSPTPLVAVMDGVAGTSPRRTLLAMIVGQCFWTTATFVFGDWAMAWTTPMVEFLGRHVVEATAVCALVILATQLRRFFFRRAPEEDEAGG